jgi:predicted membrane protein
MAYALPTNVTSVGQYMDYVVTIDPNFFNILMLGLWFIMFIGLRASPNISTPLAWVTASFGALLASILLLIGNFIGTSTILYLIGATIIGIVLLMREVA